MILKTELLKGAQTLPGPRQHECNETLSRVPLPLGSMGCFGSSWQRKTFFFVFTDFDANRIYTAKPHC